MHPSNTRQNRRELATNIIGRWDRKKVCSYAHKIHATGLVNDATGDDDLRLMVIDALVENYRANAMAFEWDWEEFKGEFTWTPEMLAVMKEDCPNPDCHCGVCEAPC